MILTSLDALHCAYLSPRGGGSMRKRFSKKLLIGMNLTAIFLLVACIAASANGMTQTITLSLKEAPLEKVFAAIKKQSDYSFVYYKDDLANGKKVNLHVSKVTIEEVLQLLFKDQPLTYTIIDKTIVVKEKEIPETKEDKSTVSPVESDITGKITDPDGNPLIGANVKVKGTGKGTTTNNKGEFILNGVDENGALEISFVGFEMQIVSIKNQTTILVSLKRSDNKLDEVQIIAYGETSRRLNTGNVSTVKAVDIEKQPVNNPLLALQGRVPGLFITQSNGLSGGGVQVLIQGQNSLQNGNDPFYVVDGVPYTSQLLPNLGYILGASKSAGSSAAFSGNPLSFLNPADIESIDVLKDADATAIYGSRAANGAILITTKKGKAGRTRVNINMQNGRGKVTRKLDLMNTRQYLDMRYEALKNDGLTPGAMFSDYDLLFWDTTRYTNWQKELIGGTAAYTDIQASVSGGNSNSQFLIGTGYHRETTVFPGDFADQKGSVHFNVNNSSPDQKFRLQLSGSYLVDNNQIPNNDLTPLAINLNPVAPSLYNQDGSLNWMLNALGSSTWGNPLGYTYNTYQNKTSNLVSNLLMSYQIVPGLYIKSNFGFTNLLSSEKVIYPLPSMLPELRPFGGGYAEYGSNNMNSWIIEPQATFKKPVGKGMLEALLGTTIQQNNNNGQQLQGTGYSSDVFLEDIRSATNINVLSTIQTVYKYNALFGRVNYNWNNQYLINLTARRDGSSRFGSKNRFHNFGAIGAAWVFSEEPLLKKTFSSVSFGKLRASYGTTGSDQIGDYKFLNLYSPVFTDIPYHGAPALEVNGLTNPFLQWEETRKLQFGLDLGFFQDRVMLNSNYFINRTSNQLLSYPLPVTTGFSDIGSNFSATVQNSGWELSLTTTNFKTRNFYWTSNINLTIHRNKLVAYENLANTPYAYVYDIGEPITRLNIYHFLGVDPATGSYQFADMHGDPTLFPDPSKDMTSVVNIAPNFYGGFHNSLKYKGFQLDLLVQFVKQKGQNHMFGHLGSFAPGISFGGYGNQPISVLDRWQQPGDIKPVQRYNSNFSVADQYNKVSNSDAGWSDASYIRLKNVSLSWQLPEKWRNKSHLKNARLYVQGQNLLTITDYLGLDPENRNALSLPPLRVLTMGIQVEL